MIANGSLAAFSTLAQPVAPAAARPVTSVPLIRTAAAEPARVAPPPAARPGQVLPRGSLLDLRV